MQSDVDADRLEMMPKLNGKYQAGLVTAQIVPPIYLDPIPNSMPAPVNAIWRAALHTVWIKQFDAWPSQSACVKLAAKENGSNNSLSDAFGVLRSALNETDHIWYPLPIHRVHEQREREFDFELINFMLT